MPLNWLRVSGNVSARTSTVRPMIAQPQLPPITEWTPSRICRKSQMSGLNALWMMLARIIGVTVSVPGHAHRATEEPLRADRVQAARAQRVAPQQAPGGEDESAKYAVVADR